MKTSDFDYHLPESCIAQTPVEPRDSTRLLILNRATEDVEHKTFRDLSLILRPDDLLVLNRTRVIPARIFAKKETGGRVEVLLLRRRDSLTWEALVGGKGLRVGKKVIVESDDSSRGGERTVVPQSAVRRDGESSVVFVVKAGRLERRAVRTGPGRGAEVEVLAGVQAGDAVVVEGPAKLRDGQRARVKE